MLCFVVWCCGRFLWCYAWVQPCCGIPWLTRVLRLYDPWLFGESLRTGLFSTDSQRDPEGTVYAATQASPCIYMSHMGMLQMTRAVGTPGTSRTVAIHKIGETAWQAARQDMHRQRHRRHQQVMQATDAINQHANEWS